MCDSNNEANDVFRPEYKALSDNQADDVAAIKGIAVDLYRAIQNVEKHGANPRQAALARTKLEESVMWAVKSITG